MRVLWIALALAAVAMAPACTAQGQPDRPTLTPQTSGSTELFIGISVVNPQTVWISGTGGTFGRTTDGGATWEIGRVAGADSLQFRDVHGVNARIAYLLSIGKGRQSRIYKTVDAGYSWTLVYENAEPEGFFDCMDFWDPDVGLAFSDAVDGTFLIVRTTTGGLGWERIPARVLPPALEGEGSFAASGTCVRAVGPKSVYIGTGAGGKARVLMSHDRGLSWSVAETPVAHGSATSGLTSMAFLDANRGVAAGGDVAAPDSSFDNVAYTEDGGRTWHLAGRTTFSGAVYGITYVPGRPTPTLVAVGPRGVDYSTDNGMTWTSLSTENYWSVAFAGDGTGWAVGTEGKILRIEFPAVP